MSRFIVLLLALTMLSFGSLGCGGATEAVKKETKTETKEPKLIKAKKPLKKFKGGRMEAADDDE